MLTFEELYISYSPDVYRFSIWLSGNAEDAEDIASETFVRAWKNFDAARTETLKAYLFTIARNIYLEWLKKNRIHGSLDDSHADLTPPVQKRLEDQSDLDIVHRILQTLPESDRSAFVMRVQSNLPYAEIARVLQLTESAVKVKVHRVRKKLFNDYQERNSHE